MTTTNTIIVRGKPLPIDAVVHGFAETGLHFTCRTRIETRVVVNHWTGAENGPEALYENMKRAVDELGKPAPKSVHFACDALGELWQFCDTEARCGHCKAHGANSWSIGIEFICRGNNFAASQQGIIRRRQTDVIHGSKVAYDDLTDSQIATGIALNEVLCRAYSLPMAVPEKNGEVYATELPAKNIERFTGCAAHFHFERKKVDNGLTLMRAIQRRGRELEPRPVA